MRKALIKITERCDLQCVHCFVSATRQGSDMPLAALTPDVVSRLIAAKVANVTLTGGEPFVHRDLIAIADRLTAKGIDVTICTNGTSVSDRDLDALVALGRVTVNVSLDGFSAESHGRFRGDRKSFDVTIDTARRLHRAGLLRGILSTPNALVQAGEYADLFDFARELRADYLLMNPLSPFGRGNRAQARLSLDAAAMNAVRAEVTSRGASDGGPEPVFTRFPNRTRPLTECVAGEIFYVTVTGDAAVCAYLLFAAENEGSRYNPEDFIFANLFRDADFAQHLENYDFHDRYVAGSNPTCASCGMTSGCGKGCPAAVVARGGSLGDLDAEVCPISQQTG